jgi:hypothetical protein
MVQQGPGRCNIKFFESSLVQAAPSRPTTAQRGSGHPRAPQAVPNFALEREMLEIGGEISHFRVHWLVQAIPARFTPAQEAYWLLRSCGGTRVGSSFAYNRNRTGERQEDSALSAYRLAPNRCDASNSASGAR